jgi:hypothetical protein
MIQVIGKDPRVIARRLRNAQDSHLENWRTVIDALVYELLFGDFGQDDELHVLYQARRGPGSFALFTDSGLELYFRAGSAHGGSVRVLDSNRQGTLLALLASDQDVRRFLGRAWKDEAARQKAVAA